MRAHLASRRQKARFACILLLAAEKQDARASCSCPFPRKQRACASCFCFPFGPRNFEFSRIAVFGAHTDLTEMTFRFLHTVETTSKKDNSNFALLLREFLNDLQKIFIEGRIWSRNNHGTWTHWALTNIKHYKLFKLPGGRAHAAASLLAAATCFGNFGGPLARISHTRRRH